MPMNSPMSWWNGSHDPDDRMLSPPHAVAELRVDLPELVADHRVRHDDALRPRRAA